LVAWAARRSGDVDSYQINGDDIVAAWVDMGADRFENRIDRVRLVCNRKKSFRGRNSKSRTGGAVFCEQFGMTRVMPDGRVRLRLETFLRLGEASGVKSLEGDRGHLVCDRLRDFAEGRVPEGFGKTPKIVRRLARSTQLKFSLGPPGRVAHGGGGGGQATRQTASCFLMGGPTSTRTIKKSKVEAEASRARLERMSQLKPGGRGAIISVADWNEREAISENARLELAGAWRARGRAKEVTRREHQKRIRCRHTEAACEDPFDLLKTEDVCTRWNSRQRSTAHRAFREGRWEAGLEYLRTHSREVADPGVLAARPQPTWLQNFSQTRGGGRGPFTT
jgi:hypothetical protein